MAGKEDYVDLPTCDAVACPLPQSAEEIIPDFIESSTRYILPNGLLRLKCRSEFYAPPHNVKCVTNQTFSAIDLPRCQAVNCVSPSGKQIRNGQITSQHLAPGTKVLIECDEGFSKMASEVRCVSGRLFSSDLDSMCLSVPCPVPAITNGHVTDNVTQLQPDDTLRYACDASYDMKDATAVYCKSGHKFSSDVQGCIAKPCPGRRLGNGYLERGGPGEVLAIGCDEGYEVKALVITCISDQIHYPEVLPSCRGEQMDN